MEKSILEALETLNVLQPMISLSAERLEGLRTQCATSAEITQHEIRTLEGKLVKLFSHQLVAKKRIPKENLPMDYRGVPSLKLWLQIVGLTNNIVGGICNRTTSLESLKDKSEHEIRTLMSENHANDEEIRRLTRALHNLKRYIEVILTQSEFKTKDQPTPASGSTTDISDLYWDSWDMHKIDSGCFSSTSSPRVPRKREARSSVPSEDYLNGSSGTLSQHSGSSSGVGPGLHLCSTTPCTPVTTMAPSSLTSPAFSPGSHPDINSPTNSSVFSPSSTSPGSFDPGLTPPPTPPIGKGIDKKFPTTPPARKKHQAASQVPRGSLQPESFLSPLTKSKSHESQLANRIESSSESNLVSPTLYLYQPPSPLRLMKNGEDSFWLNPLGMGLSLEQLPPKRRERLPTEPGTGSVGPGPPSWETASMSSFSGIPGYSSPITSSPIKSPPYTPHSENDDLDRIHTSLQVPKSPRTPTLARSMGHMISHRFTKMFKVSTCDYCFKQVIIGLKCKECKFKCHRDCEPKVPPSCGLPPAFIDEFVRSLQGDSPIQNRNSPQNLGRSIGGRKITKGPINKHVQPFPAHDSSSNTSSANSSTPSSPALYPPPNSTSSTYQNRQFHFPDVISNDRSPVPLPETPTVISSVSSSGSEMTSTVKSTDSDRTVSQTSGSGSTDSEKTLAIRVDSQDSQVSDGEPGERTWPRQNSLSNREWDIPYDELKMGDKIGIGYFGTVYRGYWHGDVAIKVLDMAYVDNEKKIEQFKQEVAIFRKTRHENLVLFMGACMKPPRLAIVTSMCKGLSLYTHLHLRRDKFNMNKTVLIAQQISQGMGYLHARGIIHKDLKSKNVFLENGKVVITDFGLFSVTKLCHGTLKGESLSIPPGWLCYLAPEMLKSLKPCQKNETDEFPFSKATDVYAFGTAWYELLSGEWPYKGLSPESIIWQVGSGVRQPLPTLFSRDVKEILLTCWAAKPEDRPEFSHLLKSLDKIPKKRLARSPSHPIHLSRSAEATMSNSNHITGHFIRQIAIAFVSMKD